ncbi:MAG: hypothetical protein E6356_17455 [Terrisporobacter othiniensis]|nr:hypothetical protein [Terrisporobacter othiniensis]MDU6996645.1 hypothetical protein [Terrisporobacter othiniensis]
MNKLNTIFIGLGTFLIGYLITTAYIPIDDAYLQSMVSIQLAILFLAGIISAWAYILYKK